MYVGMKRLEESFMQCFQELMLSVTSLLRSSYWFSLLYCRAETELGVCLGEAKTLNRDLATGLVPYTN